ncbi:MAG: NTP transferase domain-containing protein, partial [Propionibacterium sp.]|nr:NTP transferase domain-containing protein [Propionibacterium sp.]
MSPSGRRVGRSREHETFVRSSRFASNRPLTGSAEVGPRQSPTGGYAYDVEVFRWCPKRVSRLWGHDPRCRSGFLPGVRTGHVVKETLVTTSAQTPVSAVIVLAAGGGTRMKSKSSKLLHPVAGRAMLSYALDAAQALEPQKLVVVVGHLREQVEELLNENYPLVTIVEQPVRNGTGGAVKCAIPALGETTREVVVTYGDVPMLTGETLTELVAAHRESRNACTVLTAVVPDPTGYGRIVRDGGQVSRIVEHKDATQEERQIREINSGIHVFDGSVL